MQLFASELIRRLVEAQVEFVIVGGLSAVLQGVPVVTLDVDICYRRTPDNVARLAAALAPLQPKPRGFPPDLPFIFDERTILLGSNFTLLIGEESLDLLGEMIAIGGYEEIIAQASTVTIEGCAVKILSLAQLIETKRAANRPKDHLALPYLEAAYQRQQQEQPPPADEPPPAS
ncbi:MAG: hypothetical protein HYS12_14090 [Planctomycetes bacterium]|nr:hypothetical protein [Planctomycetota bacterium]